MIRSLAAALAFASLAACASTPAGDDLAAYPAALIGAWSNDAQYAAAPEDLKRPASADGDWLDRQTVTVSAAPPLAGPVVVLDWRDNDGRVRKEAWRFRHDANRRVLLDILTAPRPAHEIWSADSAGYGAACALVVTSSARGAWDARTDVDACKLLTSDGREANLDIRITVMPTGLLYQETKTLPDGSIASRRPGGTPYDFRRVQ